MFLEETMETITELYHTALLQVINKMQAQTFFRQRVHISKQEANCYTRTELFLTPRVRATKKLYAALIDALSKDIQPSGVASFLNNAKLHRSLKLPKSEFRAFLMSGAEGLLEHHRMQFAYSFEDVGVSRKIAYKIASHIVIHRSDMIAFMNAVDDTGIELALTTPGH